jgi:hypothetical protein
VTPEKARSYLNYLLTLNIRGEESFGPLALAFIKEHDLEQLGLIPEERFNLIMSTVQALANEPKRFNLKLELQQRAQKLLPATQYSNPGLAQQLDYDIRKTEAELGIYNDALKTGGGGQSLDKQRLIVQSDAPDYFLNVAQRRASEYYQEKFGLTREAKTAQHFSGAPRKFDPDNPDIQKEFSGACGPFMNARTNAFHLMLPFDLKISRKPDDALEAIVRVYYAKMGYSFPLAYEMGKLISYHDGEALDISMDDPNLLFVSASPVKEREFKYEFGDLSRNLPPDYVYPVTVLERTGTLGNFVQVVTNFKVWFDASMVSVLIQGAPDLYEYGLQGGSGLMTRSHAADKVDAYAEALKDKWKDGLSFNFVNIHLSLAPGVDTAFVPYNTPLFTVYPTLNRQCFKIEDIRKVANEG